VKFYHKIFIYLLFYYS